MVSDASESSPLLFSQGAETEGPLNGCLDWSIFDVDAPTWMGDLAGQQNAASGHELILSGLGHESGLVPVLVADDFLPCGGEKGEGQEIVRHF